MCDEQKLYSDDYITIGQLNKIKGVSWIFWIPSNRNIYTTFVIQNLNSNIIPADQNSSFRHFYQKIKTRVVLQF